MVDKLEREVGDIVLSKSLRKEVMIVGKDTSDPHPHPLWKNDVQPPCYIISVVRDKSGPLPIVENAYHRVKASDLFTEPKIES